MTLGDDEFPRSLDVKAEVGVADVFEFDADPTARTHIGRVEKSFGGRFQHRGLNTGQGWKINGYMTIVVVIVDEHDKYLVVDKERRFAVREFFDSVGESFTETADAVNLRFTHIRIVGKFLLCDL